MLTLYNKTQFIVPRADFSNPPFIVTRRPSFRNGRGFSFLVSPVSPQQIVRNRDCKAGRERMIMRLCDLNRQVAEPDVPTGLGKGEPRKMRTRILVYEGAKSSCRLCPADPEDDQVGTCR